LILQNPPHDLVAKNMPVCREEEGKKRNASYEKLDGFRIGKD
jgi:hypothetical protein